MNTRLGLHASADGGYGVGWEQPVRDEFAALKPEVVKFMSSHSEQMVGKVVEDNKLTIENFIVRVFLDWGSSTLEPHQFVDVTLGDTERTVNRIKAHGVPDEQIIVELHNEPNLTTEGLGFSWQNGTECVEFFAEVLDRYMARLPNVQYGIGALSPGGSSPFQGGNRYDSKGFLEEMLTHSRWNDFDVHLVHLYTSDDWNNNIWWLDHCQSKTPNMEIWITESFWNTGDGVSGTDYAKKLVDLMNLLDQRPTRGITFYCVSASRGNNYYNKVWCRNSNKSGDPWENIVSRGIAEEVRHLRP